MYILDAASSLLDGHSRRWGGVSSCSCSSHALYIKGVDMVLKGASVIYLVQVTMFELYYLPSWRIFRGSNYWWHFVTIVSVTLHRLVVLCFFSPFWAEGMLVLVLCHCVRKLRATWRLGRAAMQAAVVARDCHVQLTRCNCWEIKWADLILLTRSPLESKMN